MNNIYINNLTKEYSYYKKESGLSGALKGLFCREKLINKAVNEVSFSIAEGEIIGLIGPNGAGKTSILKMISGILYPTSGEISVFGYLPWKRKYDFLSQISIVMGQKNQLWWDLPAQDTFLLNKKIYNISNDDYNYRVSSLASELGVEEKLDIQVRKLSLGERMKMEIIAALLHNPKLLLLDEPTIGLDINSQKAIRNFISKYNKESGNTIILTSHYMSDVQALCERIIFLNEGKVLYDGKKDDLIDIYNKDKIINIVLNKIYRIEDLYKYGEIVNFNENRISIKVPQNSVADVVSRILLDFDVLDLSIDEMTLEDVISQLSTKSIEVK